MVVDRNCSIQGEARHAAIGLEASRQPPMPADVPPIVGGRCEQASRRVTWVDVSLLSIPLPPASPPTAPGVEVVEEGDGPRKRGISIAITRRWGDEKSGGGRKRKACRNIRRAGKQTSRNGQKMASSKETRARILACGEFLGFKERPTGGSR